MESAPLEGECILYDPSANRFLRLNRTASFIWGRLGHPASAEQIASDLVEHFKGVSAIDAVRDVRAALDDLVSMSVVEAVPGSGTTRPQGEIQ